MRYNFSHALFPKELPEVLEDLIYSFAYDRTRYQLHYRSHLPVVIDPSHGTGVARLVPDMCRAAGAAGADAPILEAHPDPEPLPSPLESADVRLYGEGAWVSYEQEDADQGRKRESRLMEKVDGEWRIAGMHTTIYGPAPRTP